MLCPRCSTPMVNENVENDTIDVCTSCRGMWLHKNQLNHLLAESDGDVETCSIDDNPHEDNYPEIKCLDCTEKVMEKINFLDYSDIILDYCSSCGAFWLDTNELNNMHNYIRKVKEGSHKVRNTSAYNILVKLSEISNAIFR